MLVVPWVLTKSLNFDGQKMIFLTDAPRIKQECSNLLSCTDQERFKGGSNRFFLSLGRKQVTNELIWMLWTDLQTRLSLSSMDTSRSAFLATTCVAIAVPNDPPPRTTTCEAHLAHGTLEDVAAVVAAPGEGAHHAATVPAGGPA